MGPRLRARRRPPPRTKCRAEAHTHIEEERMRLRGRKKGGRFLELLMEQAKYAVAGMEALSQYMKAPSDEAGEQVSRIEKAADESRRILMYKTSGNLLIA